MGAYVTGHTWVWPSCETLHFVGLSLLFTVVLLVDSETTREAVARYFPAVGSMREIDGKPTAYECQNYACELPTNELSKFSELLQ